MFLSYSYWHALCDWFDFDVFLLVSQPQPIAIASYRQVTTLTSLLPVYRNLVFGQSRNKKRKHRKVSVRNSTAVCFSVICNMFLSSQRVIQLTALEDWSVSEKQQWDSAVKFMESTLQDELDKGIQQTNSCFVVVWLFDCANCALLLVQKTSCNI